MQTMQRFISKFVAAWAAKVVHIAENSNKAAAQCGRRASVERGVERALREHVV